MPERKIDPKFNIHSSYTKLNLVNPYRYGSGEVDPGNPNMLQSPNTFTDSIWNKKYATILSTGLSDPDGGFTATEISISANIIGLYQLVPFTVPAGNQYTVSMWMKLSSGTGGIVMGFNGRTKGGNNDGMTTLFNLTTSWQKVSFTSKLTVADTGLFAIVASTSISGGSSNHPAVTLQIYNAKMEEGQQAT
jgi:hypothetical protein